MIYEDFIKMINKEFATKIIKRYTTDLCKYCYIKKSCIISENGCLNYSLFRISLSEVKKINKIYLDCLGKETQWKRNT